MGLVTSISSPPARPLFTYIYLPSVKLARPYLHTYSTLLQSPYIPISLYYTLRDLSEISESQILCVDIFSSMSPHQLILSAAKLTLFKHGQSRRWAHSLSIDLLAMFHTTSCYGLTNKYPLSVRHCAFVTLFHTPSHTRNTNAI